MLEPTLSLTDPELHVVVMRRQPLGVGRGDVCVAAHEAAQLHLEGRHQPPNTVVKALWLKDLKYELILLT